MPVVRDMLPKWTCTISTLLLFLLALLVFLSSFHFENAG